MQRVINIGGKDILMEANGATPRVYRGLFGKDILVALQHTATENGEVQDVEVFENLAYCMAKQAGSVSEDIDSWLASFDSSMDIVNAAGELLDFWLGESATTVEAKKKVAELTGQ